MKKEAIRLKRITDNTAGTFVQFMKHDNLVIINKSTTHLDLKAKLTIHDSIGEVLDYVVPKRRPSTKKKTTKKTTSKTKKTATANKTTKSTTSKTKDATKES